LLCCERQFVLSPGDGNPKKLDYPGFPPSQVGQNYGFRKVFNVNIDAYRLHKCFAGMAVAVDEGKKNTRHLQTVRNPLFPDSIEVPAENRLLHQKGEGLCWHR